MNKQKLIKKKLPIQKLPDKKRKTLSDKTKEIILLAFTIVLTFIVYANSINNDLLSWDDYTYIKENPYIQLLSFSTFKAIFSDYYFANYHPLTTLSWALELFLFKNGIAHFHVINLIIHLLNVSLIWMLIKSITRRIDVAFIVAILFAIHPMHVESVSWISERKDLLYSFFYIAAMITYVYYLSQGQKLKYLIYTFLLFILSLMSKSMSVTLPVVLIILDLYLNRRIDKKMIFEKIPFFILSIVFGIIAIKSQSTLTDPSIIAVFSFVDRIFLISWALCFYMYKAIIPVNLSALHPYPEKTGILLPYIYYFSGLFLAALVVLLFKIKAMKKELLFGVFFFLSTISVVIQIIPVGMTSVAERYSYLPYLGLFFIVGMLYKHLKDNAFKNKIFKKPLVYSLGIIMLLFFSYQTYSRNMVWKNNKALFGDVVKKYPKHYYGYFGLGNDAYEKKDYDAAYVYYTTALKYSNKEKVLYNNLGYIKIKKNDIDGAIKDFERSLQIDSKYPAPYNNRGNLKMDMKDYKGAIADFDMAISLNSNSWLNYYNRALAKSNINDITGAITDYTSSISLNPNFAMSYNNRALLKASMRDFNGAIQDYDIALNMEPKNALILLNRGICKQNMKDYKGALADFSFIISFNPGNYDAFLNRGNSKLSMLLFDEAIQDYSNVLILNPEYAAAHFNLGLCYLNKNNKKEACKHLKQALDLGAVTAEIYIEKYCK